MEFTRSGTVVDIVNRRIFAGTIHVKEGKIARIEEDAAAKGTHFILPGFIDAHIHIESSMLIPSEFARLASVHGTVGTVSDPHEIGNVLGVAGIDYMIQNSQRVPFHFYFGASSCVPATSFETAGAQIDASDIEHLFTVEKLNYLSEMMNFPGVLNRDPLVMKKLAVAESFKRPIDGHAPGLRGEAAQAYIAAGISTDHECFTLEEGLDKVQRGMHILIREGSAAKNFEALHPLIKQFPAKVMFCCDDLHPNELVKGHVNLIVKRAIFDKGHDLMDVLRAASMNPILHYGLTIGLLRLNDPADFIVVDDLKAFTILETFVKGEKIAEHGKTLIRSCPESTPNQFTITAKNAKDFAVEAKGNTIRVIQAFDGQLITKSGHVPATVKEGNIVSDIERDILKLTVVNRYQKAAPAVAFIQNFGLKRGAIASCIAHDSHNIIAVGTNDEDIAAAVNLIIDAKGGISLADGKKQHVLPLPVAGIMSNQDGYSVARKYEEMDQLAKNLGSALSAPYMTLSFMALLVIPELKLSDKGLFDGKAFRFVPLQENRL